MKKRKSKPVYVCIYKVLDGWRVYPRRLTRDEAAINPDLQILEFSEQIGGRLEIGGKLG